MIKHGQNRKGHQCYFCRECRIFYQGGKCLAELGPIKKKRPNLTPIEQEQLIRAYESGLSSTDVATLYGVGETTLLRWLDKYGIVRRQPKDARKSKQWRMRKDGISEQERAAIVEMLRAGLSRQEIAKRLHRPAVTICRVAEIEGYPHKCKLDDETLARAFSLYQSGLAGQALADQIGVTREYLNHKMKEAGLAIRDVKEAAKIRKLPYRRALPPEQEIEACEMYKKGASQKAVAQHFEVSQTTIIQIRKRYGIPTMRRTYLPTKSGRRLPYRTPDGKTTYFRSSWEIAFAEYLDRKQVSWEYETIEFPLSDGTIYIPDFHIPEWNMIVEIKGYMWKDAKQKISGFREEYPDKHLLLVNKKALPLYGIRADKKGHAVITGL